MSNLNFTFTINKDYIKEVISALKDLASIDPMIKMKMDQEHVLFYSKSGTGTNIAALKSFIFPVQDFLMSDDDQINIDFIIINGKNFVDNLSLLVNDKSDIVCKLDYREKDKVASIFNLSNGKLKLNFITGDYKQIKDITKHEIENKLNPDLANFSFILDQEQFKDIKKLIRLNKSEIVSIRIKKNKLQFYDKRWTYDICDLTEDVDDETYSFSNKFLKTLDNKTDMVIYMFDQFLVVKDDNVALLIGLELSTL